MRPCLRLKSRQSSKLQLRKSFDRLLNAVWQEAALGLFEVTGRKVRYELQLQWKAAGLAWFPRRPNRVRLPRASSDCGPLDSWRKTLDCRAAAVLAALEVPVPSRRVLALCGPVADALRRLVRLLQKERTVRAVASSSSQIYWNEFWKEPVPSNCVFAYKDKAHVEARLGGLRYMFRVVADDEHRKRGSVRAAHDDGLVLRSPALGQERGWRSFLEAQLRACQRQTWIFPTGSFQPDASKYRLHFETTTGLKFAPPDFVLLVSFGRALATATDSGFGCARRPAF